MLVTLSCTMEPNKGTSSPHCWFKPWFAKMETSITPMSLGCWSGRTLNECSVRWHLDHVSATALVLILEVSSRNFGGWWGETWIARKQKYLQRSCFMVVKNYLVVARTNRCMWNWKRPASWFKAKDRHWCGTFCSSGLDEIPCAQTRLKRRPWKCDCVVWFDNHPFDTHLFHLKGKRMLQYVWVGCWMAIGVLLSERISFWSRGRKNVWLVNFGLLLVCTRNPCQNWTQLCFYASQTPRAAPAKLGWSIEVFANDRFNWLLLLATQNVQHWLSYEEKNA